MNCPNCARENPANAKFCIYCAAQLVAEPAVETKPTPAVGPTVRLQPQPTPAYSLPTEPQPQPAPSAPQSGRSFGPWAHFGEGPIGAVFLIGLGVLILTGSVFPGILVLLGITGFMREQGRGRPQKALQALVFFGGLAVLFATGNVFPGILFLLGAMYLVGRGRHGHGWC